MTRLNEPQVLFDQAAHTYTDIATGEMLHGITSTVMHALFPDRLSGIPQQILDRAAARGTAVHEECELIASLGVEPCSEDGRAYAALLKEHRLEPIATEYTVSGFGFATNIDAVYEGAQYGSVQIADIKTTYRLDEEYVSWQLSICAEMLELCNPFVKTERLFAVWLRGGKARLVEVKRRTRAEVAAACEAAINGETYKWQKDADADLTAALKILAETKAEIDALQSEFDNQKALVMARLSETGLRTIETPLCKATITQGGTARSFDTARFKAENPELYDRYLSERETKPSLRLTLA